MRSIFLHDFLLVFLLGKIVTVGAHSFVSAAPRPATDSFSGQGQHVASSATLSVRSLQQERALNLLEDVGEPVCQVPWRFDSSRHRSVYTVGVLAIRGFEAAYREFNTTFGPYLTATAGRRFDGVNLTFVMKPLNFVSLFDDVENQDVDFIYVNPSAYSCMESQYTAQSLVSQISRRVIAGQTHLLSKFGGCIYTRADNDEIQTIQDLKGKIVAAASISGLGSGQMQFLEMVRAGMSYINDPRQLVFTSNQGKVIQGVLSGQFDVGFVRTDQLERSKTKDGQPVNLTDFKLIDPREGLHIDGVPFPFAASTDLYPEWNVAALKHVPPDVSQAVQQALLALRHHADYGDFLAEWEDALLQNSSFLPAVPSKPIPCDSTAEIARLAKMARQQGKYASWQTTLSYMQLRSMQEATGFIAQQPDTDTWACVRSKRLYDAISCPDGYRIKSEEEVTSSCVDAGVECAEGFQCVCSPCTFIELCLHGITLGGRCVPYSKFLPSLLVPLAVVTVLLVWAIVEYNRRQADSVWKIKPSDLVFEDPPRVVGVGTYGYVMLAEYRGTQVAVKRVIPPKTSRPLFLKALQNAADKHLQSLPGKFSDVEMPSSNTEGSPDQDVNLGLKTMTPDMMKHRMYSSTGASSSVRHKKKSYSQLRNDFVLEMRHLAKLRHPCITTVMGAVLTYHEPMMVMEYMDHGSLHEALRNENLQYQIKDSMMVILQDIARGLRFLHQAHPQVIHGDLKARNVLIDANLRAKVADFGMSHKNYRNRASGTPFWMAPELFMKRAVNTSSSDIYAFGILIYELYACEDPYPGENVDDVLRQVCDPTIDKRPPIPGTAPPRIAELMKECIVRDPNSRPTAEQVDLLLRVEENVLERTTRLETLNKNLASANEKIASASALQLEHFASMSHEIRTPLNCIIGMSSLLDESQDMKESQQESVRMIMSSGRLLRQIIDDVLDYSKLESGRFEIIIERTDLQEVFMDCVNSMKRSLVMRNRQVTLHSYIDPTLDRYVQTDSRRLQQVLYNLLSNAVKYNRIQGRVDFDVRLLQAGQPLPPLHSPLLVTSERVLRLTVKDTGKGIERSEFENIFRPFTQTKTGWQSTEGGTGLGLSITRKLVERLGGKITVNSRIGEWSMFTVDFPHTGETADVLRLKDKLRNVVVLFVNAGDSEQFQASCAVYDLQILVFQDLNELSGKQLPAADTYILAIHGDLHSEEDLAKLPGSETWVLVTFGTESSAERARVHYFSLEQQFPLNVMVDLAQAVEESKKVANVKAQKKAVTIVPDAVSMSHLRILLAEDNLVNQKVMKRLLNRMGVTKVDIAENGQRAVELEAADEYDAVLMDMNMPIMSGIEATREILRRDGGHPQPRIIFVTAHVSDSFRTTCLENGARDYIAKPCTIDGLRKTLIKNLITS